MQMRGHIKADPETNLSQELFAVVYAPRNTRKRFAHGCVEPMADADTARAGANPQQHRFAARVFGPSKSSEGQYLYYLLEWL
jgi:hypothetical protein